MVAGEQVEADIKQIDFLPNEGEELERYRVNPES